MYVARIFEGASREDWFGRRATRDRRIRRRATRDARRDFGLEIELLKFVIYGYVDIIYGYVNIIYGYVNITL